MIKRKSILITGCARGIGRGLVHHFTNQQTQVFGIDNDSEEGNLLREELQHPENYTFFEGDVSDEETVKKMYEQIVEQTGGSLNGLVNNAAVANAYSTPVEELDLETWNRYLAVNLTGPMLNTKYAVPFLRKAGGAIVNLSSTRALMSEPNSECYATTKGGITALTHSLAISLGPDIRVNAIAPGWIDVSRHKGKKSDPYEFRDVDIDQHPAGRVGTPEDVAHLAEYLLSEKSRFVTGQMFTIDGGMTKKMIYEH
jgi:NAD(P)-dependent dehydrogenase (short-subunit alcohol dehydrogenase family)